MSDDEAKLSWRLAELAHRLDWWNVKAEHTPFEWACQLARSVVEPFGDERADMRTAHATGVAVMAQSADSPTEQQSSELYELLRFYLKSNTPEERVLSPAQAQAMHG